MAVCLQIESLEKAFGERVLFSDITFSLDQGEKVALIAVNGIGKSTLLNIIAGREDYQKGKITFRKDTRIGFLEQDPKFKPEATVLEACFQSSQRVREVIECYENAIHSGEGITEAMAQMDVVGAWDYEHKAHEILSRLGLNDFSQTCGTLSGGQAKRLALAAVLIQEPDLLILDEPTNHLDLDMTEWLEDYLAESKATLLMVTHDRYFLDRVCNRIIEIDDKRVYGYRGNYTYYIEKRQQRIDQINAAAEKTRNLYRRELEWIHATPCARTGKAKYRIDAFETLSQQRRTQLRTEKVNIGIEASRIGTKIFEMKNLCKSFPQKTILKDFEYTFTKGEKLGIIGANGVGKSTFIKMLLGLEKPDSGTIDVGSTVKFGYYSQSGLEFNPSDRVIDIVKKISEDITMSDGSRLSASQFLQQFLFSPSHQYDLVAKLSGGEKRRLYLCTVLISNPNFLVLDEPTNDLDIQTMTILEEYIRGFSGCVIIVSHDRYFMDKIADHVFVMQGEGAIKDFPGNYTQYKIWQQAEADRIARECETKSKPVQAAPQPKRTYENRLSFKERKELEALDGEIASLEKQKGELEKAMSSGEMDVTALMKAGEEIQQIIEAIELKTERWMELSEKES